METLKGDHSILQGFFTPICLSSRKARLLSPPLYVLRGAGNIRATRNCADNSRTAHTVETKRGEKIKWRKKRITSAKGED